MKSAASLITLPFLLFALTTTFVSAAFMDPPVPILDSKGVPLSPSAEYYISQLTRGPTGGGLEVGQGRSNITCPLIVLQDYYHAIRGQKVKFSIRGKTSDRIMTGTPLDIAFVDKPSCASSSKWVMVSDNYPAQWIGIGDAAKLPGKRVVSGEFTIQKYSFSEGYKFMFCPTDTPTCLNIGRREDKNGRRLILTNETRTYFIFEVGFDKVI